MQLERAVGGPQHVHARQRVDALDDVAGVFGVAAVDAEVADDVVAARLVDVDGPNVTAGLADRRGDGAEDAGDVVDPHTHEDLVPGYRALVLIDDACLGDARELGRVCGHVLPLPWLREVL